MMTVMMMMGNGDDYDDHDNGERDDVVWFVLEYLGAG